MTLDNLTAIIMILVIITSIYLEQKSLSIINRRRRILIILIATLIVLVSIPFIIGSKNGNVLAICIGFPFAFIQVQRSAHQIRELTFDNVRNVNVNNNEINKKTDDIDNKDRNAIQEATQEQAKYGWKVLTLSIFIICLMFLLVETKRIDDNGVLLLVVLSFISCFSGSLAFNLFSGSRLKLWDLQMQTRETWAILCSLVPVALWLLVLITGMAGLAGVGPGVP